MTGRVSRVTQQREWSRYHFAGTGIELLEASFVTHVYTRHFHDTYAIGVTLRGVQQFHCGGRSHASTPGDVIVIPPGETHDGESGTRDGYAYRMFYVAEPMLRAWMADVAGSDKLALRGGTLLHDPAIAEALSGAWTALSERPDSLAAEERLLYAMSGLAARIPSTDADAPAAYEPTLSLVRDYLHDHLRNRVTLGELAAVARMSRFQLTRRFQRAYGLPLHAYHLQIRLQEAGRRVAKGESITRVAFELGFADQSHMNKRFKAAFGVTPGQWQAASLERPSVPGVSR
jgi:AraC-like DNA-binding protein